jgi:hypothetical protein
MYDYKNTKLLDEIVYKGLLMKVKRYIDTCSYRNCHCVKAE